MCRRFLLQTTSTVSRYRRFSSSNTSSENVILTGIEPNGPMHIGNYYGTFKNCVSMQNSSRYVLCSVSDMLSVTLPYKPLQLQENILVTTACLIGCGLEPEKSIIFLQSQIPQHSQLCWVLGCLTDLNELPTNKKDVPLGLYLRPLVQAADILLYKSSHLCVGYEKSLQLPIVHNLAKKFNDKYGETFHVPSPVIYTSASIKNLKNPTKKMSKSGNNDKGRINLTDTPDVMFSKIKKAVTDSTSHVTYEPETRPGVSNLVAIHSAATGMRPEELCDEATNLDTGMYKLRVAEALIESLKPINSCINNLLTDKAYLASILDSGTERASVLAAQTWGVVREKIGNRLLEQ